MTMFSSGGGGKAANDLGDERVERLKKLLGEDFDEVEKEVVVPGMKTRRIDVTAKNPDRYYEIGGPKKAANLGNFGSQMKYLAAAAKIDNAIPYFMYDVGTPQIVLEHAARWIPRSNILPLP